MPIYLQHGNLIDYVPPTDTTTEDVVFMGGLVGVPQTFIPAGELGALSVDGVYIFNKKEGVSVSIGDVVKYCGTTKLAQDSNADLPLGVAVADAEADDYGVKVKINSVLPTDGGGGGGEVAVSCGLAFNDDGELVVANGCGITFGGDGELIVNVARGCGIAFNESGQLVADGGGGEVSIDTSRGLSETSRGIGINIGTGLSFGCSGELNATGGGGGGGEVAIDTSRGLSYYADCSIGINIGSGLAFDCGQLVATGGGGGGEVAVNCGLRIYDGYIGIDLDASCSGLGITEYGQLTIKVCTASGLSIDQDGYLTYNG